MVAPGVVGLLADRPLSRLDHGRGQQPAVAEACPVAPCAECVHTHRVANHRVRSHIGNVERRCDLCGHDGLILGRSRARRSGWALVNPWWDARERTWELCPQCGARYARENRPRRRHSS